MTEKELLELLNSHEWNDVEFKEAQTAVPRNAYETVSAFANTCGGHLVFGVKKNGTNFEVVGVLELDKVQNDFINTLRQPDKVSFLLAFQEETKQFENKDLLIFYIPEAPRVNKPVSVKLKDSRWGSFLRKGGCDIRCTPEELNRLIRDASTETYDNQISEDINANNFFDEGTVSWYRKIFNQRQPGRHETLSDQEFLLEWGFIKEVSEKLVPTRGGILLFGKGRYVRQILPRAIVDYQRIDARFDDWIPEKRWNDRLVFEDNIFNAWFGLQEKYKLLSESSFSIDSSTMRRSDDPPDYISFREAAINLLIHQDYGDHTRKPVLQFFKDRTIFWNPGDAFATTAELLDSTQKEVRNPLIVNAFRRIGLSEQAGTGIRTIYKNWRDLGNIPPEVFNDKAEKTFELCLLKEKLLSEEQILFQSTIGVKLTNEQASVFAYACKNDELSMFDVKAITGKTGSECREIINYLVQTQRLLKVIDDNNFEIADHLKKQLVKNEPDLVTSESDQVPPKHVVDLVTPESDQVKKITEKHRVILRKCEAPTGISIAELQEILDLKHRTSFRNNYIKPLINMGLITMTNPENPTAHNQKYTLTDDGLRLIQSWEKKSD